MKRNVYLLGSVGLAIVAGGLFAFSYAQIAAEVPIVIAKSQILANTPISSDELTTTKVPKAYAEQAGAATNSSEVLGKYLSVSLVPGEAVTSSMLSGTNNIQSTLSAYASANHTSGVLMSLPASTSLAATVQPGQDVGLLVPGQGRGAMPQLLAPIRVLTVQEPPKQSSGGSFGSTSNGGGSATLLLFVPNDQFYPVAQALIGGNTTLVLLSSAQEIPTVPTASSPPSVSVHSVPASKTVTGRNVPAS